MKAVYNGKPADATWTDGSGTVVGAEYEVISLTSNYSGKVTLQIVGSQKQLSIQDSANFTLSDSAIPLGWSTRLMPGGGVDIGPAPFIQPGFWEDYYDNVPAAVATVIRILGFEPR